MDEQLARLALSVDRNCEFHVTAAETLGAGMRLAQTQSFDAIILDLQLALTGNQPQLARRIGEWRCISHLTLVLPCNKVAEQPCGRCLVNTASNDAC
jgi:hypothetical protein